MSSQCHCFVAGLKLVEHLKHAAGTRISIILLEIIWGPVGCVLDVFMKAFRFPYKHVIGLLISIGHVSTAAGQTAMKQSPMTSCNLVSVGLTARFLVGDARVRG